MYAPLALLFPCAVPTALPTIFYLEHGHEHVPAEAHGSLRGAKVEKVAAVPPSQLADTLVGFPPGHVATKWEEMGRGFRELARLVSHLEALRQATFDERRPSSLLQRYATADEVASMICYLCSPAASASNGAAFRCDGGIVKTPF